MLDYILTAVVSVCIKKTLLKETQMCRADFWTPRERERVGWFGRMALKHVYYHVKTNRQSRFDTGYRMLGAGALG